MLGIPLIHPKGGFLPTVVGQFDEFDAFVSDSSVLTPPDPFELSFLPLDEAKFCFIKCLPYDEGQYAAIMEQAMHYEIRADITGTMTYQMKQAATENLAIRPEIMLVKDGRFVGILIYSIIREEAYMHTQHSESGYGILFTDGTDFGLCRSEYRMQPGGGWCRVSYRLVPRTPSPAEGTE